MLSKLTVVSAIGLLSFIAVSPSAHAAVITERSAIESIILADTSGSQLLETGVGDTSFSQTYEDDSAVLNWKADTSTGTVGTSSYSKGDSGQTIVKIFDTIEFSGLLMPTTISYSLGMDGSFYTDSLFDSAYFQSYVRIYDITGLDSWLETEDFFGVFDDTTPVAEANELSVTAFHVSSEEGVYGLFSFDELENGMFTAEAGKTYGIEILGNAFSTGENAYSDFFNTSTFGFTDLGGATFTSGSGTFLSAAAPSVPEPLSFGMLGLGLLGLTWRRIRTS